ncbi:MAG: hypothetical protein JWO86_1840 [Myxococcaceae bacterium]|nr:hypothetical protein [Myxococcaceae bacterium]
MSFPRSVKPFLAFLGVFGALGVSALAAGCDKDEPKPGSASSTANTVTTAPSATTPAPAPAATATGKPQLAVDDTAAFVAGERIELASDSKGRIAGALSGKPVEGETLVLNAARDAKLPKVAAVFAALLSKKAKAVEVHTPLRDRSNADVVFVLDAKPEGCSAVGYIAKDSAIATWPASGATAERFTHGMAGPDLTRGSEGIRKRVLACDLPTWFAAADDNVTWGLVFDMVVAVMRPDDAGLPKARSVALLTKTPVPGRKVDAE